MGEVRGFSTDLTAHAAVPGSPVAAAGRSGRGFLARHGGGQAQVGHRFGVPTLALQRTSRHQVCVLLGRIAVEHPAQLRLGPLELGGEVIRSGQQQPWCNIAGGFADHLRQQRGSAEIVAGVEKSRPRSYVSMIVTSSPSRLDRVGSLMIRTWLT